MAPLRKLAVLPLAAGFSPSLFDPIRVSDRSGDMSFFRSTAPFFDDFGMLSMRKGLLFDRAMRAEQDDDFLADTPFGVRPAPEQHMDDSGSPEKASSISSYSYSSSSYTTRGADGEVRTSIKRRYRDSTGREKEMTEQRFQDTATGEMSRRTLRDAASETTTFTGLPEGSTDERFDELWDRDTKRTLGGPSSEKA